MAKEDQSSQRILTPEFRVFFPHVFKPQGFQGAKPKFSITMAFPKNKDLSIVKLAIKHAKISEFGPDPKGWAKCQSPVVDGDNLKYAKLEGYAGNWIIKASSSEDQRPGVVNYPDCGDITDQSEFYPGCFARAQLFARVWEFPQGSDRYGVHFILDHVQKLREGTPIGGKKSAKQAFGALADSEPENEEMGF